MSQLPSQVWSPRRNGYQGPLYNCESVKGCLGTAIVDKVEEVEVGEGGINLGGAEEGGEAWYLKSQRILSLRRCLPSECLGLGGLCLYLRSKFHTSIV